MPGYFVLDCPVCDAHRAVPAADVDSDGLVRVVATHLLSAHPDVSPTEAEPAIEDALDDPTPFEAEAPLDELGWTTEPFPVDEEGDGASSKPADGSPGDRSEGGSPFDDWIGN